MAEKKKTTRKAPAKKKAAEAGKTKPKKEDKIKSEIKTESPTQAKNKPTAKNLSPDPREKLQPEVNIGLVGHVDHGKTTLTERLSGKWTDTHSEEIKRGITIRLGYANSIFRKCPKCKGPGAYTTHTVCEKCNTPSEFVRKVSFVDAPGHESLMATMLAGTTIMDGALLLVAANEECPQPQTREHLMALQIAGIKKVIVVQNKIDLVSKEQALKNYAQIKAFLKNTEYCDIPIIPISAKLKINIGFLIKTIEEVIITPQRDITKEPMFLVARSFDINKPGCKPENIKGGVLGGTLIQGRIKTGDMIEIVPGHKTEKANQMIWLPIKTKVISIMTGSDHIEEAGPGGSIALLTTLDPSIIKSDSMTGNTVGVIGKVPPVWYEFGLKTHLLERVVGTKEDLVVEQIKLGETLMLNVNSTATVGVVYELGKGSFKCKLKLPVAATISSRITISRRIGTRFRLIGFGEIIE